MLPQPFAYYILAAAWFGIDQLPMQDAESSRLEAEPSHSKVQRQSDPPVKVTAALLQKHGPECFQTLAKEQKPLIPFSAIQRGKARFCT